MIQALRLFPELLDLIALSVCFSSTTFSLLMGNGLDEFIFRATHDRTIDWLLPGVPPTGRKLSIPMIAVVNIRGDRLYNGERDVHAARGT